METGDDKDDMAGLKPQVTVEELINIIKVKEIQIEQLRTKLSEYREKGDSLQETSLTQKSHLARAQSDPVPSQNKRNSHPEIFLFPDNRNKCVQQTQEPLRLLSPPLENSSKCMEPESVQGSLCLNKVDIGTDPDTSVNLRSNIPTSWLDPSMAPQGSVGVSEQYFKNVLNELVKTKKYLNNLLTHQNQSSDKTLELNNLRQEVQQLQFNKTLLERELDFFKEENCKLKKKVSQGKADDSFELESRVLWSTKATQTDHQAEATQKNLQLLFDQITKLEFEKQNLAGKFHYALENAMKENRGLKRELEESQGSYKSLSTQVLNLSTLLQEEQVKNKSMDEGLRKKTVDAKRLSEQLCILRQKYEELMEEKNALEKNLALIGPRIRHHSQPRSVPAPSFPSGPRFHSHDKPRQPSLEQMQWRPQLPANDPRLNNLSRDERKLSNLPNPLHFPLSTGALGTATVICEDCPTCLQTFTDEKSFHSHLEKCIE